MTLVNDEMATKLLTVGRIIATVCAVLLANLFLQKFFFRREKQQRQSKRTLPLPPGPKPWPLIGNLPALGARPHQALSKLAKTYGPLMYLRLGSVSTIIVSSSEMSEQILKTHDKVFASRPCVTSCQIMGYGSQNIGFLPYGDQWRNARKLFTTELLPVKRVEKTKRLRKEEILLMLHSVVEESQRGEGKSAVPLFNHFFRMTTNIVSRLSVSKRLFGSLDAAPFGSNEFRDAVIEEVRLFGAFNISDYIPFLKRFDLQGYERQMRVVHKKMDSILQGLLDSRLEELRRVDHLHAYDNNESEDFLTLLLSHPTEATGQPMKQDEIKGILVDILLAGTDTTAITLEWAMAELLKDPSAMRRCEEELDAVVGRERLVDEEDLPKLQYLLAVVKETFRLHPAGALMIPHTAMEDCEVGGYFIPEQSRVMVNVWAIGRDPAVWDRALEFCPQRFLADQMDAGVDVQGRDFKLLPFGSGRRSCPGRTLALRVVQYTLAVIVQSCQWALPHGSSGAAHPQELDMSEKFALGVAKAEGLEAIATLRLPPSVVYLNE